MNDYAEYLTDGQDRALAVRAVVEKYKDSKDDPRMLRDLEDALKPRPVCNVMTNAWDSLESTFYPIPSYAAGTVFKAWENGDYRIVADGLIALGAEANTGKTSVMTALAIGLLENNPDMCAVIYALDDGAPMVTRRVVGQLLARDVQFAHQVPWADLGRIQAAQSILGRLFVRDRLELATMEADIEDAKRATGCNRIYVGIDYLQIVPVPESAQGSKREGYNQALKKIKEIQQALAREGCIILLLSQLNRDKENEAHMGRFRETSEIENQADVGLLMQGDEEGRGLWIKIIKNKRGKRGRWWKSELLEGNTLKAWEVSDPPKKKGGNNGGPVVDMEAIERNAKKIDTEALTKKADKNTRTKQQVRMGDLR